VVKLAQLTLNYLQNQNLFSNHYLESLIKDSPEWNEDVGQAFARAREIYDSRRDSWKNLDESMLENPTNYRHLQEWYEYPMDKLQPLMGEYRLRMGLPTR